MKRTVHKYNIIATAVKVMICPFGLIGLSVHYLRGGAFEFVAAAVIMGFVTGIPVGLWAIRRLERAGHRFPKVVEDGAPWIPEEPPSV